MKKLFLSFFILLAAGGFTSLQKPPTVVIIGGGPAGLSTAIEACQNGAYVTVVEKRDVYKRKQRIFLSDHSLELLEKWEVDHPELKKIQAGKDRIGIVRISALEEALSKRAKMLGVAFLKEEFLALSPKDHSLILTNGASLSYDILVAADGIHSKVREALGIEVDLLGKAKASVAIVPSSKEASPSIDISDDIQHGDSFIKKFYFPGINLMFLQGPSSATQQDFIDLCKASNWVFQAEEIAADRATLFTEIDVYLQKAKSFCSSHQKAILVGDAAGTGTFFRGKGANFALKTAKMAGDFFRKNDFKVFEKEMKESTSALIKDSAFLFHKVLPKDSNNN